MKHQLAALVVVTAFGISGVGIVAGAPSPASTVSPPLGIFDGIVDFLDGLLDGLQNLIERLDEFLEAIVDLLETLGKLFGEGGEGGD
jgi:hypothetical protein